MLWLIVFICHGCRYFPITQGSAIELCHDSRSRICFHQEVVSRMIESLINGFIFLYVSIYNSSLTFSQAYAALDVNKTSSLKSLSITCGFGSIPDTQINRSSM